MIHFFFLTLYGAGLLVLFRPCDFTPQSFESVSLFSYRLRGARIYACNVVYDRWRLILAVAAAVTLVTILCSLLALPRYTSTSILRVQPDITDIE